jgi:hypothetical protein
MSKPTIKQKLAAVRMLHDFLVVRQIVSSNPAHSVHGPTIAGYEAIHMIRKGQASCRPTGAKVGLLHRFILGLFETRS